jgi:excisionase family DNA binding protein
VQEQFSSMDDLLKFLIEEAINKALSGKLPYPSAPVTVNDKKILTRKQAAEYLQVTPNTLTRYVRQGKLLPAIINGKYRFFESDLINFLKSKAKAA